MPDLLSIDYCEVETCDKVKVRMHQYKEILPLFTGAVKNHNLKLYEGVNIVLELVVRADCYEFKRGAKVRK